MRVKKGPIRLLTAVPICDGHDSAISTINLELVRHGVEVVYLGYHRSAADIARAAVQEDVGGVGISSYNGGHVEFFSEVMDELRRRGRADIALFGGGGGTISRQDARTMIDRGVLKIFFPGTSLDEMADFVQQQFGGGSHPPRSGARASGSLQTPPGRQSATGGDCRLGSALTAAVLDPRAMPRGRAREPRRTPEVFGVAGPGGAGKTTLIDELVLRFLRARPESRVAVLSHDPSVIGKGALLGDRAAMFYCQDDRVFLRSLSTAGHAGGVAAATGRCLELLKSSEEPFDVIFLETVGIGQEALPFGQGRARPAKRESRGTVDHTLLVMSPDYGSRLQLQKIAMLDVADGVVINKSDLASAPAAISEIEQRMRLNRLGQNVFATTAKRHRDAGVDALFSWIIERTDLGVRPRNNPGSPGTSGDGVKGRLSESRVAPFLLS